MTIHLFGLFRRPGAIPALAALALVAVLIAPPPPAHAASARPTASLAQGIGMGEKPSVRVRVVQRALDQRGYDLGAPGVDGRFGPLTATAVRRFQANSSLAVDGIVGPHTRRALRLAHDFMSTTSRHRRELERAEANRSHASSPTRRAVGSTETHSSRPVTATQRLSSTMPTSQRSEEPRIDTPRAMSRSTWLLVAVASGAIAALIGALWVRLLRAARKRPLDRRKRTPHPPEARRWRFGSPVTPLATNVYLEAEPNDESIGPVRGFAIALALNQNGGGPERCFLVDDPSKPQPVWVGESAVGPEYRDDLDRYGSPAPWADLGPPGRSPNARIPEMRT
jgi:hypothetical protein